MLQSRGIVLRTIKYGETSVISDIFTEEKGLLTFIGGSVRTPKARMPFNLFQPMMQVDLVAYYRESGKEMHRLKEMRAAKVYERIPFEVKRGAVALFMAEVCRKCIVESEENPELFQFVADYLHLLDTTEQAIANIHLHFMIRLSEHLGFLPERTPGVFLDMVEGVFVTEAPAHLHLTEQSTTHFSRLLLCKPEACHEVKLQKQERKELLQGLLKFYRFHVPGFEGVNSPAILEMVI